MNKKDNLRSDENHKENKTQGWKIKLRSGGSNLSGQRRHLFNATFKLNPE